MTKSKVIVGCESDRPEDFELDIWRDHSKREINCLISGEMNENFYTKFWKQINLLIESEYAVKLNFNSIGGSVYVYRMCLDQMERLREVHKINGFVSVAASSAVPLFTACDYKYCGPGSLIMLHQGAIEFKTDHIENTEEWLKKQNQLHREYIKHIAKNNNKYHLADSIFDQWCKTERRFFGKEIVQYGFADTMLHNPKDNNV